MKILGEKQKIQTETEIQIAKYSADDIKRLIVSDLDKQGFTTIAADISFVTDWKNVSDEMGMNRHIVTMFEGAKAKIS